MHLCFRTLSGFWAVLNAPNHTCQSLRFKWTKDQQVLFPQPYARDSCRSVCLITKVWIPYAKQTVTYICSFARSSYEFDLASVRMDKVNFKCWTCFNQEILKCLSVDPSFIKTPGSKNYDCTCCGWFCSRFQSQFILLRDRRQCRNRFPLADMFVTFASVFYRHHVFIMDVTSSRDDTVRFSTSRHPAAR